MFSTQGAACRFRLPRQSRAGRARRSAHGSLVRECRLINHGDFQIERRRCPCACNSQRRQVELEAEQPLGVGLPKSSTSGGDSVVGIAAPARSRRTWFAEKVVGLHLAFHSSARQIVRAIVSS